MSYHVSDKGCFRLTEAFFGHGECLNAIKYIGYWSYVGKGQPETLAALKINVLLDIITRIVMQICSRL